MIETRPDWCVSRQRVWGVPLPLFVSKETGQPLRDLEVVERIADIYEEEGSDTWFTEDPQRFLGEKYNLEDYDQVKDVVEVWFDSGSTHAFCLEKREDLKWPASMYLEGSDQHRGWFHSSLLESSGTRGRAPYESVLTHGFVVDGKGRKMSKSLGNVISPDDILKKYGVDILRLWVVASDYYDDLKLDNNILQSQTDSYRRIRNTFRYLIGNLEGFTNEEKIGEEDFPDLEKFILHRLWEVDKTIQECVKTFNFHLMFTTLLNFCSNDLSAFYFDIRKDTLYCDKINSEKRKSTVLFLNILLDILLKWFAPILSFTTEEIYSLVKMNGKSIHLESFPSIPEQWKNSKLESKWVELIKIREACNSSIEIKRASKEIGSSLEASLIIKLEDKLLDLTKDVDFSELCITSNAKVEKNSSNEINVETLKAEGQKCPVCWKIRENKCSRQSCPNI